MGYYSVGPMIRAGGRVGVFDGPEWFRASWLGRAVEDSDPATRRGLHSTFLWPTQIPASLGMRYCVVMMPTEVLEELFDPVGECLTPEVASELVALRAPPRVQARIDELADKCSDGALTPAGGTAESVASLYDTGLPVLGSAHTEHWQASGTGRFSIVEVVVPANNGMHPRAALRGAAGNAQRSAQRGAP